MKIKVNLSDFRYMIEEASNYVFLKKTSSFLYRALFLKIEDGKLKVFNYFRNLKFLGNIDCKIIKQEDTTKNITLELSELLKHIHNILKFKVEDIYINIEKDRCVLTSTDIEIILDKFDVSLEDTKILEDIISNKAEIIGEVSFNINDVIVGLFKQLATISSNVDTTNLLQKYMNIKFMSNNGYLTMAAVDETIAIIYNMKKEYKGPDFFVLKDILKYFSKRKYYEKYEMKIKFQVSQFEYMRKKKKMKINRVVMSYENYSVIYYANFTKFFDVLNAVPDLNKYAYAIETNTVKMNKLLNILPDLSSTKLKDIENLAITPESKLKTINNKVKMAKAIDGLVIKNELKQEVTLNKNLLSLAIDTTMFRTFCIYANMPNDVIVLKTSDNKIITLMQPFIRKDK